MKPKILYKYRADNEYTEKILTDKKIWLSKPSSLNDPFECSIANFTERVKDIIATKRMMLQISSFFYWAEVFLKDKKEFFGMSGKNLKNFLKRLRTKNNLRKYQLINEAIYTYSGHHLSHPNDIVKSLEDRLENIGIFSLSATDTNQLMWTHYANEHKGIALGFEVTPDSKLSEDKYCIPVNYIDELPKFDDNKLFAELQYSSNEERPKLIIPFDDPTLRACMSTKPTVWEYEKEWRYIDETDGLHQFPGKLVEITFGLRCPLETRKKYLKLASDHFDYPIKFYEIVKKKDTNQIEKREYIPIGSL